MKKCCLTLLVSLLALALPACAGAATSGARKSGAGPVPATIFGANVGAEFTWQERGLRTKSQVAADLAALHAAGGRVGRGDSNWAETEPKPPVRGLHTYDWTFDDMAASEMATAGLRWEPTLGFAPRWAEVHGSNVLHLKTGPAMAFLPPASNATFAAYATAFMRRYGPHGTFWAANPQIPYVPVTTVEVWNEPDNIHDWGRNINLSNYARMYEVIRTVVHRVYPRAVVMTGGLAWTLTSLPRLLRAFRGLPMDALAIHPYGKTPSQSIAVARAAIADMRQAGRGRTPVAANEYGWTSRQKTWAATNPRNVTSYVYQALIGLAKLHVSEVLPFLWGDPRWGLQTGSFARGVATLARARHSQS